MYTRIVGKTLAKNISVDSGNLDCIYNMTMKDYVLNFKVIFLSTVFSVPLKSDFFVSSSLSENPSL